MLAAANGQWEVCLKLAELGADLNLADRVSETCCNCISVCCCIVVMPLAFKTSLQRRLSFTLGAFSFEIQNVVVIYIYHPSTCRNQRCIMIIPHSL